MGLRKLKNIKPKFKQSFKYLKLFYSLKINLISEMGPRTVSGFHVYWAVKNHNYSLTVVFYFTALRVPQVINLNY